MYITMVDPTLGMMEVEEIPTVVSMEQKGTTNKVFDEISAQISTLE